MKHIYHSGDDMLSVGLRIPKKTIAVLLLAIIAAAVIIVVKSVHAADKKTVAEFDGSAAYDYISSFGVCADDGGLVTDEITVPEYFGDVYKNYNDVQLSQGFDLAKYKGCTLKRFTFPLSDRENAFAEVLSYNGAVVGADVYSTSADGTISALK